MKAKSQPYHDFISAICTDKKRALVLLRSDPSLLELRDISGETPLQYLTIENRATDVDWLIAQGANAGSQDNLGNTPLIYAAWLGYQDLGALILKHDTSPNHQNANGETALFMAASHGRLSLCDMLLKAGADPLITDGFQTIIEASLARKRADFIALLESHGFDKARMDQSFGGDDESQT